jgi:transmembrane sensor
VNINSEILDEAAHWLIELNSDEASFETRQAFDAWLRRSPEHLRAYLELLPGWEDGAALPVGNGVAINELIAMGRSESTNVVTLSARAHSERVGHRGIRHRSWALAFAATAAFIAIATAVAWKAYFEGRYSTDVAEQRTVTLDDGSTIHLNPGSGLRVRFSSAARSVEMLRGQALFNVAKDAARPFIVEAGDTWVRAVGTQFDVNRRRRSTVVTVVEGTVAVSQSEDAAAAPMPPVESLKTAKIDSEPGHVEQDKGVLLKAGEQVTIKPHGVTSPKAVPAEIVKPTDWTQRRLTFDDSTLGEVIEEFNRYNERRLVIRSPELESFPITATFSSSDIVSLVQFLETQPAIRVVAGSHEIEIFTHL